MPKKIIIVGAGPIGCYTAQLLKVYGYRPLVIEEHSEVGRPTHCTGLVGSRVFDEKRPFSLPSASILNVINGAKIHYDSQSFFIERKKVAYVIDRERFDKDLSRDLDILYHNRFLGLENDGNGYIVETDKDELRADLVIGADGANSTLRKILGQDNNIRYYKGVQLRIKTKPRYKDLVEVYLKKPNFFWVVPETEDIVRIGTISDNPHHELQDFLKEIKINGAVLERFGGLVALGICTTSLKDNIALVGDAACQVKPISYGGIYFGLRAASILASCIKENRLGAYDIRWKREFATEIKIGLKVRDIYNRLDADEIRQVFKLLKTQKSVIEKRGDFESHGRIILEIIKKPSIYRQLGSLFQIFFRKII